jgi:hypothetical protein
MRGNKKLINRGKLLAAVLAVNGFAFYAFGQDTSSSSSSTTVTDTTTSNGNNNTSSSSSTSSDAAPSAVHDLSQGAVVPNSRVTTPGANNQNTTATNQNRTATNGTVTNGTSGSASVTTNNNANGVANGGSVNNTGVVNPNVNPNNVTNSNGVNANTPAGATIDASGSSTISNGATIDTSTRGTARGTVNPDGTVNNGAADASNPAGVNAPGTNPNLNNGTTTGTAGVGAANTAGVGAANTAGVGAANTAGVGAANTAGAGASNSAGVGASNSAGAGASNSAGAGASNSAGAGAANSAGVGASNSAGVGASSATDSAQSAGSTTPGAFNNAGSAAGQFNNGTPAAVRPGTTTPGKMNTTGTGTNGTSTSGTTSGGHVDASSAIQGPVYLDDLSEYSRPKPNKDTPDTSSPHADEAIPSGSTISRSDNSSSSSYDNSAAKSDTDAKRDSRSLNSDASTASSSIQANVNGQALSSASDAGQVRQMLAQTTEAALSKDGSERLAKNFDKIDQKRLDLSSAKFDDLNMKIDQFNQDWREKYGRDFAIRQPEMVFNDEYRFMPGGVSTETARTASERIEPSSSGEKDLSGRSDYGDSRTQYRTTTSEESSPYGASGSAHIRSSENSDRSDLSSGARVSSDTNTQTSQTTVSGQTSGDNPTGQLLPRDATYHDGTKMKSDGTIQRNDISSVNRRPDQLNVPTGNSVNDRDPANHDRPDASHAAIQRDVIDASAQQSSQRIERAYTDTTTHTDATTSNNSNSVDLRPGQTAEIDSSTGTVRRDVAGDGVALRGPSANAQASADLNADQQSASVQRALVIVPASYGLPQLSVPMIKEDGQWKLCVPDNEDAQKLHDALLRHISMMDDQKATWPSDVNDATRMANHQILAAIYEPQQKSASLTPSDAEK